MRNLLNAFVMKLTRLQIESFLNSNYDYGDYFLTYRGDDYYYVGSVLTPMGWVVTLCNSITGKYVALPCF